MEIAAESATEGSDAMETRPRIETERLVLRHWRDDDADTLFRYASDPEIGPIAGWPVHGSIGESRHVIADVFAGPEVYAVTIKGRVPADEPVGSIGLLSGSASNLDIPDDQAEISYWIGHPFWGQGYIPEAVGAIIRHAFIDLELTVVWCGWYEGNQKSQRVAEKTGFHAHHVVLNMLRPLMGDTQTAHISSLTREQWLAAQRNDPSDTDTIEQQQTEGATIDKGIRLISRIRSGGQTGADRGALDAAREAGVPICGWCPKDGLAEDMPEPPGLLRDYPELVETPGSDYVQRTAWNVRDSHATLVIAPGGLEPHSGTAMTVEFAHDFNRPVLVIDDPDQDVADILSWLGGVGRGLTLNVAGPRGSKLPDVYDITKNIVSQLLTDR